MVDLRRVSTFQILDQPQILWKLEEDLIVAFPDISFPLVNADFRESAVFIRCCTRMY